MAEIKQNSTYYLEILVTDKNGDGETGLTVTYKIIRSSDNVLVDSGTLTDVGDGVYQGSYYFDSLGQYRVVYITPTKYSDSLETVNVLELVSETTKGQIQRILGLCHENFRVEQPVYNQAGDLTDGIIKIYDNATDLENDVNPIAVYDVKTTYKPGSKRRLVHEYICKRIT